MSKGSYQKDHSGLYTRLRESQVRFAYSKFIICSTLSYPLENLNWCFSYADGKIFALKQVNLDGMKRVDREETIDEVSAVELVIETCCQCPRMFESISPYSIIAPPELILL